MYNKLFQITFFLFCLSSVFSQIPSNTYEERLEKILSQMTLEEKVGQMTQLSIDMFIKYQNGQPVYPRTLDTDRLKEAILNHHIGSILNVGGDAPTLDIWRQTIKDIQSIAAQTRLKIPVLYGIDAIHGNNYTADAVLFPQQIAQAASFNRDLVRKAAEASAYETRASFIPWTFSPVQDLGRNPVWPRIWETFGEDPLLASEMGTACISGYQGENMGDKYRVAACLKHYAGYSFPLSGHDRSPAWIPERELREYFIKPFESPVKAGAASVMVNSAEINGLPVHANYHMLTEILKDELGFDGVVVSDWQDIQYLFQRHKIAANNDEAVMMAINAGIDMSMVPTDYTFTESLIRLANQGKVPVSRIDDAVRRILRMKMRLNLFENPVGNEQDYPDFNSQKHNDLNFEFASECITLLKNEKNLLPLNPNSKIFVTGQFSQSMNTLNGGWSRNWQGTNSDVTEKDHNHIFEAIQKQFGSAKVTGTTGFDSEGKIIDLKATIKQASKADVIIISVGEPNYCETPGNINDLNLPVEQIFFVKELAKTGKPIILILTEGRPRIISELVPLATGIIHAYLPGNEGGNALAAILAGKVNPSGRLPYTYPRNANGLHNYYRKYTDNKEFDPAGGYDPQWEFGFGLSYSEMEYSDLQISSPHLSPSGFINLSVKVTNKSNLDAKESVLLFVSDLVASVTPEYKRLRGFEKIQLKPMESKIVTFTLSKDDLSFYNHQLKQVTEPGHFKVSIGQLSTTFEYR